MSFNQGNPVVWFEIYVQDMERAKAFYEAVFAIKLEPIPSPEGWQIGRASCRERV